MVTVVDRHEIAARERESELIWNLMPELVNRHSSIWWFFLLFPKQAGGFGPQQLMFVTITKAGNQYTIDGRRHPGLNIHMLRPGGPQDRFPAVTLGWVYDGRQMHDGMFNHCASTTLSRAGYLQSWQEAGDGRRYGSELVWSHSGRPYGLNAEYCGGNGRASYEVWGKAGSDVTVPAQSVDIRTPLGSSHVIAWQQLAFEGDFAWPGGGGYLSGLGYFQRVCLNFNPFPWKWMWALFDDESVFCCFIPYIGPHLFRHGRHFFHQLIEQATIPVRGGGYFYWADRQQRVNFSRRRVTPILNGRSYPDFLVECQNEEGDFVRFRAVPHAQAHMLLEEEPLGIWPFRFNYNEFLFRIVDLEGSIGGRQVNAAVVGNGYGNCEYTWGLGR